MEDTIKKLQDETLRLQREMVSLQKEYIQSLMEGASYMNMILAFKKIVPHEEYRKIIDKYMIKEGGD